MMLVLIVFVLKMLTKKVSSLLGFCNFVVIL